MLKCSIWGESRRIRACALQVHATLILRRSPCASRSSITHTGLSGQWSWRLDTSWPLMPLRIPGVRRLYGLLAQPNISWHKTAFILVLQRFIGFSIWFICVWQPPSPTLCSPNTLDICLWLLVFTLHLHFDYVFAWDLWPLTPQERKRFIKNMVNRW